jgi:hypothetical protein
MLDIETIGLVAFVTAATGIAGMAYERRMDVLYGPYIERRFNRPPVRVQSHLRILIDRTLDDLRWKARNIVYLTSIVAG